MTDAQEHTRPMSSAFNWIRYLFQAIVAGLALAFLVVYLFPSLALRVTPADPNGIQPAPAAPASYSEAVNRAAPAVVSIYTRTYARQEVTPEMQRLLGNRALYRIRRDEGSGVLVSEDGYILTNHHVVGGVSNVRVALWDGREAQAELVGSDPETDLAVLKINVNNLPVAPIAESPRIQVGDVVLAIGNALGLSHTVTMGIVSATGRNTADALRYQDLIQTDAAINAGNSGGALINTRGELIGINARNLSPIRGAENIGFAIPATIARNVMEQIIEYGEVQRGWLGVLASNMPPSSQGDGSTARRGIEVREVTRGSPGWEAGLRQGDVILSMNGEETNDAHAFLLAISQMAPGTEVEFVVRRGYDEFQTHTNLIQQPPLE
ncbi:MAG: trypsin-like peptidase domain-containing protein [Xanthomonadales bacterium]|nr:trypsin-like peptidase domain-containing protein [Xanthomonadales bacterium]